MVFVFNIHTLNMHFIMKNIYFLIVFLFINLLSLAENSPTNIRAPLKTNC